MTAKNNWYEMKLRLLREENERLKQQLSSSTNKPEYNHGR